MRTLRERRRTTPYLVEPPTHFVALTPAHSQVERETSKPFSPGEKVVCVSKPDEGSRNKVALNRANSVNALTRFVALTPALSQGEREAR